MEKNYNEINASRCRGKCAGPGQGQAPDIELQKQHQKCHGSQEISAGTAAVKSVAKE
jgi:hypothetical protein